MNADTVRVMATLPADSTGWLALCSVSIVITAVLAYLAGMYYARGIRRRALQRARRSLQRLYSHTVHCLDDAQRACRELQAGFSQRLSTTQRERLASRQSQLLEAMHDILAPPEEEFTEPEPIPPPQAIPEIGWLRTPEDSVTKLPNREAFETNFQRLREAMAPDGWMSGLLLARIDKLDQLNVRFGMRGINDFSRKTAQLICRALPERGLAARLSRETFAVLLPAMNLNAAKDAADAIRQAVRRYRFRLTESDGDGGPEVLVTASFGLTLLTPEETLQDALSRAEAAVTRSQRRGRNQLHVEDGTRLVLCPAGEHSPLAVTG